MPRSATWSLVRAHLARARRAGVRHQQRHLFLSDRGSTNGTLCAPDGKRDAGAVRQPLLDGSRLRLADDVVLVFRAHCQRWAP